MHPELERLIDLALADGVLSDKERQVLYRKAQELGVDMDEFEMVLEARTHIAVKSARALEAPSQESKPQSTKEGALRKCPSCGAPVPAFTLACSSCGHEFRGAAAASSLQQLFETLQGAPLETHATLISNFPVPNSREDILEFLSAALGNCTPLTGEQRMTYQNDGFFSSGYKSALGHREAEIKAWQSKFTTVLQKGRILSTDSTTSALLCDFEKRFEAAVTSVSKAQKKNFKEVFIGLGIALLVIFGLMAIGEDSHKDDRIRETQRLDAIVEQVQKDIEARNFSSALVKASSIKWTYSDSWSHYEQEKKSWDERRESMVQSIKEAQRTTR